jgi:hypothetical protein
MVATESSQLLLKEKSKGKCTIYTKNTEINFSISLLFMKTNQARSLVDK